MLQTVRDACKFDPKAIDYALSDQIENLDDLIGHDPKPAQVVAISGRSISRDKHLWGDIAAQLGKSEKFLEFYKGAPIAPNEKDWIELIGDAPTLVWG